MDLLNKDTKEKAMDNAQKIHLDPKKLFTGRNLMFMLLAGVLLLALLWPVFHKKKDRSVKTNPATEQNRVVFKESDLKEMVEKKEAEKPKATAQRSKNTKENKRNYATDIAVFVSEKEKEKEAPQSAFSRRNQNQKLGLPPGTKIRALLEGTLFSFNVEAPVIAIVSKDIFWQGKVVIPKESKFMGEAGVLKSLNRLNVDFHKLVFPDGKEMRVRAMALSGDGSSGIQGKVSKHRDMRVLKAIGETALAGVSLFAGGLSRDAFSLEDQLRLNLSQNLTNEARQDLRSVKVETSITVEGFTPIQILLLDGI